MHLALATLPVMPPANFIFLFGIAVLGQSSTGSKVHRLQKMSLSKLQNEDIWDGPWPEKKRQKKEECWNLERLHNTVLIDKRSTFDFLFRRKLISSQEYCQTCGGDMALVNAPE